MGKIEIRKKSHFLTANLNLETNNQGKINNWSKQLNQQRKSFKITRKNSPSLVSYGKMDLEEDNKLIIPFLMKTNMKILNLTLGNEQKEKQKKIE